MSELYTYFRISEAAEKLSALYGKYGQKVFFLVPATLDKDTLTDLITGGKAVFGERPAIMTIGELYGKTVEKDDKPLRVIDPPDHKLILKYLVEEYKNENNGRKFPAGMEHAGFVTLLSDNIHTLIKEGISPELLYTKLADFRIGVESVFVDVYVECAHFLVAELVDERHRLMEFVRVKAFRHAVAQSVKLEQYVFVKVAELLVWNHVLRRVKAIEVAEQESCRVSDSAVFFRERFEYFFRDAHVASVV